ncbi:type VI secretion system baseplate subunit TssF [Maridesulfovibrio zosterae]|uniref:type VI secretion system baseplate subunit TssF n=1 Tax=Maridesulfovibrio zosterae TaxID=82171 RepID=UPI0004055971|nr:type VI secretion system baseplate subunit TssF [Maridesulfovibrio zosterae]
MASHESDAGVRDYYQSELAYLRKAGMEFAKHYPRIAGRLELGPDITPDPFTERLIESFAWLTARIRRNIDAEIPQVSTTLLGMLYPNFTSPVPSMSIAELSPDPDKGDLTSGYTIPAGTKLHCAAQDGDVTLRWSTAWPVTVYPVSVVEAVFEPPSLYNFQGRATHASTVLRLRLRGQGVPLSACILSTLRIFLHGDCFDTFPLYEALVSGVLDVCLRSPHDNPDASPLSLGAKNLKPVGFTPEELLLPRGSYSHPAYQLIQEYFAFPERFLFVDIAGLEQLKSTSDSVDILIPLSQVPARRTVVNSAMFRTGAVPVVNLFEKISEPIRLDETQSEYRLIADARRNLSTEIHSIESVSAVEPGRTETLRIEPYFALTHHMIAERARLFWLMRRSPAFTGTPGTDVYLSFTDLDFNPMSPPARTVFARLLCTNRHLAASAQAETLLDRDINMPVGDIRLLLKPTQQRSPSIGGAAMWRLISHLSLNHLSLDGPQATDALREILRLYAADDDIPSQQQIQGVKNIQCRPVAKRIGNLAWRGFVRGTCMELTLEESNFAGGSGFVFASVLNGFFGLYANVNTFTQLTLKSAGRKGVWYQWPPKTGCQPVL